MPTFDVIIIGGGTMGSSTALALARRGHNALVLDAHSPPHTLAEHHGERRMFRTSYHEHPGYVPLLRRALHGWQQLERESATRVLFLTGAVYAGPRHGIVVPNAKAAALEHALPHRDLSRHDLLRLWPGAALPGIDAGLAEDSAGYILCEQAITQTLALAKTRGAAVRAHEPVLDWSADARAVRVRTSRDTYDAASLIVTPGPGAASMLAELGVRFAVTRQIQAWATPDAREPLPFRHCWAVERADGSLLYGFPPDPATGETKFAIHAPGAPIDPAAPLAEPTLDELDNLRSAAQEHFPAFARASIRAATCRYTNSPDGHFVIDRHPRHANVVVAAGFSGHGFKFAPAVGELLADLAEAPESPHPAPFLGLSRFPQTRE